MASTTVGPIPTSRKFLSSNRRPEEEVKLDVPIVKEPTKMKYSRLCSRHKDLEGSYEGVLKGRQ